LSHGKVCLSAPHQPGPVKQPNGRRSNYKERQQVSVRAGISQRRPESACHQKEPQEKTNEQKYLPETAKVYVLVTLMAKPEVGDKPQFLLNAQPLPSQRAHNNH